MDAATVREQLGLDDTFTPWLAALDAVTPAAPAPLPTDDDATALLRQLRVPDDDIPIVVNARPDSRELRWIVDREHHVLVSTMGDRAMSWWPPLRVAHERATQFVHVWAFLATIPAVRAYHSERGIPDDVSWVTLADLGQNVHENHLYFGDAGLEVPWWLTLHFRGAIYQLGRLQFERRVSQGQDALGLHIPEIGPMTPEACDASIAWAHEFFPRHFPEEDVQVGTCNSWLLDPQLAEYLPADSNIVRFQRGFTLRPERSVDDNTGICRFVFHDPTPDLDAVPQDTTLQRAIVKHIRSGRSWQVCVGSLEW